MSDGSKRRADGQVQSEHPIPTPRCTNCGCAAARHAAGPLCLACRAQADYHAANMEAKPGRVKPARQSLAKRQAPPEPTVEELATWALNAGLIRAEARASGTAIHFDYPGAPLPWMGVGAEYSIADGLRLTRTVFANMPEVTDPLTELRRRLRGESISAGQADQSQAPLTESFPLMAARLNPTRPDRATRRARRQCWSIPTLTRRLQRWPRRTWPGSGLASASFERLAIPGMVR